ncbi:hypothetical protein HON52_01380 [Candidatus Uhrbacteria bacterium]|nr:hypothetical protein [Candidatus Uhrbacteria bacterium]
MIKKYHLSTGEMVVNAAEYGHVFSGGNLDGYSVQKWWSAGVDSPSLMTEGHRYFRDMAGAESWVRDAPVERRMTGEVFVLTSDGVSGIVFGAKFTEVTISN